MQLGLVLAVFALIFVAELPDKTMIATLIMGSRYRPVLVWIGARPPSPSTPPWPCWPAGCSRCSPTGWVEGGHRRCSSPAGAAYLLFVPEKERGGARARRRPTRRRPACRPIATAFGVIFVGEFGDLTQILTANLAAQYHQPLAVFIGAFAALVTVAALGAFGGRALLRVPAVGGHPQGRRGPAGRLRRLLAGDDHLGLSGPVDGSAPYPPG